MRLHWAPASQPACTIHSHLQHADAQVNQYGARLLLASDSWRHTSQVITSLVTGSRCTPRCES